MPPLLSYRAYRSWRRVRQLHPEGRKLLLAQGLPLRGSAFQVLNVNVRTQTRVVCEVPANVVGILVDHDLIARPVPARYDVVIERGDIPVETAFQCRFCILR